MVRSEERNRTSWIATVRLPDGSELACTVKDVSKSGARLGIPSNQALPEAFLLRIVGREFICRVRIAWRRGDYTGVRIEHVSKAVRVPKRGAAGVAPSLIASEKPETAAEGGGVGVPSRRAISSLL
ncbi:PilZ domain-containing protein [Methylobacterium sp. CM6247]